MKKFTSALLIALFGPLHALHAEPPQKPDLPPQEALDAAMMQQRSKAIQALDDATRSAVAPRTAPDVDMARANEMGGVDPQEIAQRYMQQQDQSAPTETLYVFISKSLPMATLQLLGEQAMQAKAILVLRGIPGGLEGYKDMLESLTPVIATGAEIQVHPELFDRFGVTTVPTFVLARHEEGCLGDRCDGDSISVAGDVSIAYALEHLSARTHPLAQSANRMLEALQ